jgi:hypothetical protein
MNWPPSSKRVDSVVRWRRIDLKRVLVVHPAAPLMAKHV